MHGMTRRTLLAATPAAGLTALAGCSSDGDKHTAAKGKSGEKISLSFWSWVPGIDKAIDLWNQQNPQVRVNLEKVSAVDGAQYAKMHAALKAGNPPDLAQIEYANVPSFLLDQGLVDLSKYGAEQHKDKFVGWQWQQSVFNDKVYAIPQGSGPMAMFYRTDLFEKWGVQPPATWDDYAAAAEKVRGRGAYIATFSPTAGGWLTGLAWQAGAKWFGTEGDTWTVAIDSAPTRKVADFWQHLVEQHLVKTEPDRQNAWYSDVQSGQIVNWVGAQWGDALLTGNAPKTAGKWRVVPMPQWEKGANASANWGGSTTALLAEKHPQEALDFAIWLNTDPKSIDLLIKGGYGWPGAKGGSQGTVLEQPSAFFGGQKYNEVFAASDKAVDTSWQWGPTTDILFKHLGDELTKAINSKGSFSDAIGRVHQLTVADIKARGLKVESRG